MRRSLISAAAIVLFTGAADARVTRIEIGRSEPFAANQQFGDTGAYQKIIGRFYGELIPRTRSMPASSISPTHLAMPAAASDTAPTSTF